MRQKLQLLGAMLNDFVWDCDTFVNTHTETVKSLFVGWLPTVPPPLFGLIMIRWCRFVFIFAKFMSCASSQKRGHVTRNCGLGGGSFVGCDEIAGASRVLLELATADATAELMYVCACVCVCRLCTVGVDAVGIVCDCVHERMTAGLQQSLSLIGRMSRVYVCVFFGMLYACDDFMGLLLEWGAYSGDGGNLMHEST